MTVALQSLDVLWTNLIHTLFFFLIIKHSTLRKTTFVTKYCFYIFKKKKKIRK